MRHLTLIAITLLLTGCVTTQRVTQNTVLNENLGIMATNFSCGYGLQYADIYAGGTALPASATSYLAPYATGRIAAMICDADSMVSIELPAGDYYIGKIGGGMGQVMFPEHKAVKFTVKPNVINYVGHIRASTKTHLLVIKLDTPGVIDKSEEAKKELSEKFPAIMEKYKFVTNLAKSK